MLAAKSRKLLATRASLLMIGRVSSTDIDRPTRERRWLTLTRDALPAQAAHRRWPVSADHCFQRILLDHACGGRWYDHIAARPAYRHAPDAILNAAIALGEAVLAGSADLAALNDQSLRWRGKR